MACNKKTDNKKTCPCCKGSGFICVMIGNPYSLNGHFRQDHDWKRCHVCVSTGEISE